MATSGGARALGIDHEFGALDKDKSARFLAVSLPDHVRTADELARYLVVDNAMIKPFWIIEP
jgi:cytosine/adenosine deaminase-related metal-dependent hydrolase